MIAILDKYLFIFSYFLIILIFAWLIFSRRKIILIKNKHFLTYMLASLQLMFLIFEMVIHLTRGSWYHLLLKDLSLAAIFISIFVFFFDWKLGYKIMMPWFLISATISMLGIQGTIADSGFADGIYNYFSHVLLLIQGILAYLWVDKYRKKEVLLTFTFPVLLICWILLIGFLPWKVTGDIRWAVFSSGLLPTSFEKQDIFYQINGIVKTELIRDFTFIGNLKIPYPGSTIFFYGLIITLDLLIVAIKNFGHKLSFKIFKRKKYYET